MTRRTPSTHPAGFSLVEVMIVVTVLGIIGAIAAPMLTPNDATKLRAAASILAADLDACRAESIAHSEDPRAIVFDTDNNTYHLAAVSDTDTPLTNVSNATPYTVTSGRGDTEHLNGVTILAAGTGDDDRITFGVYGQLEELTDSVIYLQAGDSNIPIFIDNASGEVTIGDLFGPGGGGGS